MCEDSSSFLSTDAWIAAANSAMTSKFDALGGNQHYSNAKIKRRRSGAAPRVAEEGQGKPASGDEDVVREKLKDKILELLEKRAQSSTICPSEAPRALHPETWRDFMDVTREAARQLALDGRVEITQKGRALDPEDPLRGPIRLRLASGKPPTTSGPPNSK